MNQEMQLAGGSSNRTPTLRDLAAVFFRQKRVLGYSFAIIFVFGAVYTCASPSYISQMKIVVRHGRIDPAVSPTQTAPPVVERENVTEEELNSEVELLRDEDLLREVVIQTGLAQKQTWLSRLRRETEEERTSRAVARLAKKLEVQPLRKSQVITIKYSSSDPQLSAVVLRNLEELYLRRHEQIQRPPGQHMFFEQQLKNSRGVLDAAQRDLAHFIRRHGIVSGAVERDLLLQRISEAQSSELGLQAEIAENGERARTLDAKLRELPQRRVVQIKRSDNPQLQEKLKSRLLELQLKRTELLMKFQPSYRLVQEVDREIALATSAIKAEDLKPLHDEVTEEDPDYQWANSQRIRTAIELAALQKRDKVTRGQLTAYQSEAQVLAQGAIEQQDLEQKLRAAEDTYLLYAKKCEEARIGDALDETGILNVAIAQEPRTPAVPARPLWAGVGLSFLFASVFGIGATFVADYVDPSFRTPGEVERVLRSPVLASLPGTAIRSVGRDL